MDASSLTASVTNSDARELLIYISVFIPIAGAVLSVIAALLNIPTDIIFVSVVYLYLLSLSAYLWNRDLQYGVLEYTKKSSDGTEEISSSLSKVMENVSSIGDDLRLMKEEDMYSCNVGIDEWYEKYRTKIDEASEEIWITQNSKQSPHRLGHEEYKEAFKALVQKAKESDVEVSWIISSSSDRKLKWMFRVLEELHSEDNVTIAVPELDESYWDHPLPLLQSFQIIDNYVFGIDMKHGKRPKDSSGRGPNEENHFYSEDTVLHEQISRYVHEWWSFSTSINKKKYIDLENLFRVSLTESENTDRVLDKLEDTVGIIIDGSKIDEEDITEVIERIITDEEFECEYEKLELLVDKLIYDDDRQSRLKTKINDPDEDTRQSTIDELP